MITRKETKILVGDFETTVYEGQTSTEVWASALVELYSDDVAILHSIDDTYKALLDYDCNIRLYYHNLKFDGMFWLDYIMRTLKFEQAFIDDVPVKTFEMKNNTFKYLISDTGQVYSITLRAAGNTIELRDSYKLLPFSVEDIGRSFKTKHQKLSMEYEGYRYAGCVITDEEKKYIANDVLVVKEALEIMYEEKHNKLTIGSCCMAEYKKLAPFMNDERSVFMPNMKDIEIDESVYGSPNADAYIRKAYKGGWCYVNPKYQKKVLGNGYTLDVNSLYPSMMVREDRLYPVGKPTFWTGERPDITYEGLNRKDVYFFIRVRVKFRIKPDHLPFIQMKHSFFYARNQCLTTSNYVDPDGVEHEYLVKDGERIPCRLTLTLTCTDYYLMLEHYDIQEIEVLDGCYFSTMSGHWLFHNYIDKYKQIKMTSKGAKRQLAKLFLNNLYGKLATSDNSSFKYVELKDDVISFRTIPEFNKPVVYIPIGSAITSYAREFTIRAAQKNYKNFVYADTDSIHCVGDVKNVKGVTLHDTEFSCWKHESTWDIGYFTRQKTYIEHVIDNGEPFYDVKCAGMNNKCKELFIRSLTGDLAREDEELTDDEREFLSKKRELSDFDIGLKVPDKLVPRRMKGGIVLVNTDYTMR